MATVRRLVTELGVAVPTSDQARLRGYENALSDAKVQAQLATERLDAFKRELSRKPRGDITDTERRKLADFKDQAAITKNAVKRLNLTLASTRVRMRQAARATPQLSAGLDQVAVRASRVKSFLVGIIATVVTGRLFEFLTTGFAKTADEAAKGSQAIGINAEEWQGLSFVAQSNNIQMTQLAGAMGKSNKKIVEASKGAKDAKEAFKDLGIKIRDSNGQLKFGLPLLLEMADKFKQLPVSAKKSQLLFKFFEESGPKFASIMNSGADAIRNQMVEAKKLGLVVSGKQAAEAEKFNDALLKFKSVIIGVRNAIAVQLLPKLTIVLNRFSDWAKRNDNLARTVRTVKKVALFLVQVLGALAAAKLAKGIRSVTIGLVQMAKALTGVGSAALSAQVKSGIFFAALVGLFFVIAELVKLVQGKDNLFTKLLGEKGAAELRGFVLGIIAEFQKLGPVFREIWAEVGPEIKKLFKLIKPFIGPLIRLFGKVLILAVKTLVVAVRAVIVALQFVIDIVKSIITAFKVVGAAIDRVGKSLENAFGPMVAIWDAIIAKIRLALALAGVLGVAGAGAGDAGTGAEARRIVAAEEKRQAAARGGTGAGGIGAGGKGPVTQNNKSTVNITVNEAAGFTAADIAKLTKEQQTAQWRQQFKDLKKVNP